MSRSGGDYAPRGPERWDRNRFEAAARGPPVIERDRYEEVDYYSSGGRRRESAPRDREVVFKEEERFDVGRRGSRGAPRRFYEEEERDRYEGAMVRRPREDSRERERGFEIDIREREVEREAPPFRPRFVRRQSSLDTYDRKPMPRYGDRVREETVVVPRGGGPRRRSPPRYHSPPRVEERDYYEDIRVADTDRYGDDVYRGYREREVERVRRRDRHDDNDEETIIEAEEEEIIEEKEFPRRGKTKMPLRLVEKRAVIELGYPFEEEGDTLIILKALGKDHIDKVITRSKEIRKSGNVVEKKERTTYIYETKSPSPPPQEGKVIERRTEIIREDDVPRSVREWDAMSTSKKSTHKSKSRRDSVSSSSSSSDDHKSSHHSHHSRRRSSHHTHRRSRSTASPRREVIFAEERDESATVRAGIGALVVTDRDRDRRSSKSIQKEIRALDAERRALQLERDSDGLRGEGRSGEIIIARDKEDVVEVRKDKKAPDPRIIRAMLATLT